MHCEKLLAILVACIIAFSLPLRGKYESNIALCFWVIQFVKCGGNGKSELKREEKREREKLISNCNLYNIICRMHSFIYRTRWQQKGDCAHTRMRFCLLPSLHNSFCWHRRNRKRSLSILKVTWQHLPALKCYNFAAGESKCCGKPADFAH